MYGQTDLCRRLFVLRPDRRIWATVEQPVSFLASITAYNRVNFKTIELSLSSSRTIIYCIRPGVIRKRTAFPHVGATKRLTLHPSERPINVSDRCFVIHPRLSSRLVSDRIAAFQIEMIPSSWRGCTITLRRAKLPRRHRHVAIFFSLSKKVSKVVGLWSIISACHFCFLAIFFSKSKWFLPLGVAAPLRYGGLKCPAGTAMLPFFFLFPKMYRRLSGSDQSSRHVIFVSLSFFFNSRFAFSCYNIHHWIPLVRCRRAGAIAQGRHLASGTVDLVIFSTDEDGAWNIPINSWAKPAVGVPTRPWSLWPSNSKLASA